MMSQTQARMAEARPSAARAWWLPADVPAPRAPSQPAAVLDPIDRLGTRRTVRRGQEIYGAGDLAGHCYRIVSGSVRMVGLDNEGRRQIADFLLPGDLFGLDALGTHHLSAEAVTDTVVMCCPRRAVEALAEQDGALARRLRDFTLQSLRRAHEKMFLLGRKSAGERVASFLLEMAARAPGSGRGAVELPMTRGDIADHLGLTIETVSRNMTQLCREGAIATAKSGIEIRDGEALAAFGSDARH
jgi:CRP/FNR family transcriptional regulator, nitrogen fixation regulation protein